MKYVWIIVIFGIVGTGAYLATNQGSLQNKGQAIAASTTGPDGEIIEVDISELSGMAKVFAKFKNAFTRNKSSSKKEVTASASRDLGRLGRHFRSAPPKSK